MSMTIGPRVTQMPPGMPGADFVGVGIGGQPAGGFGDSVRVTVSSRGGVAGDSSVNPAVEAAITRDDALGGLFGKAFTLLAPPMPPLKS